MQITPQHASEGATWITYILVAIGGALAFFDHHSGGIMAAAALLTALVNWYYRRRSHQWDGLTERRK